MGCKLKLLTAMILAGLSTAGFASVKIWEYKQPASVPIQVFSFTGYYVGASIGGDSNFFTHRDSFGSTIDQGEISPLIGIFGGYGQMVGREYYLGGELYLNDTLGDATTNTNNPDGGGVGTHVGVQTRDSIGLSFTPGFLLSEYTLGYGRIGPVWTHYNTSVTSPTASHTNSNRKLGLEIGIGLRTSLTDSLDLRLEYSHSMYSTWKSTVNSYDFKALGDRMNLGILYRFG